MATIYLEREFSVRSTQDELWPYVAQTDKLNREVGLPPIEFESVPDSRGGTELYGTARVAGMIVRYRELPFEWVRPRRHQVKRIFQNGPLRTFIGGTELRATESGCQIRTFAELVPRWKSMTFALRAFGSRAIDELVEACKSFDKAIQGELATAYPKHSANEPVNRERLARAIESLRQVSADDSMISHIERYIAESPPEDLVQIRAFALADHWNLPRRAVLEECLRAAQIGIFDVAWRVLCPYCRGQRSLLPSLKNLEKIAHCDSCNITFDSEFDQNVELCFSVSKAIRPVAADVYCIGGPGQSPHVIAQWWILPAEERLDSMKLPRGKICVKSPHGTTPIEIDCDHADGILRVCFENSQLRAEYDRNASRNEQNVLLKNATTAPVTIRIENETWRSTVCTAAYVSTLQPFRSLFSSEVLSPGAELSVNRLTILFTDLKGSTQMYRERGDAASYRAVRDHFEILREVIAEHEGAIVKTIGDAVMAVFYDPANGVRAALAMHSSIHRQLAELSLKVGIHCGSAIVVNSGGILDYFGQTVNLAARLQRIAGANETIVSSDILADPDVENFLSSSPRQIEQFEVEPAGIGHRVSVARLI